MCWFAHGAGELRTGYDDLTKYMNEVYMPKYTRVKSWKLVTNPNRRPDAMGSQ